MSIDQAGLAAIADARSRSLLDRAPHEISVDPDAGARQHLQSLARMNPAIGTAEGLLATTTIPVVPVDRDTLTPSGEPFRGFSDAVQHYQARPHDGAALALGPQRDGSTLVAVRATAAAWSAWLAEHGTETRQILSDEGHVESESRSYLDPGRHTKVHWSPPGVAARTTAVVVGRAALMVEGEKVRADRAGVGETGWVAWSIGAAWSVAGKDGMRLSFKDRPLDHGVVLVASGVLPMAAHRADGWTLSPDPPAWMSGAASRKAGMPFRCKRIDLV